MSYTDSNLNDPYHGDFVFAVTQESINEALFEYLGNLPLPEVTCVWVMNTNNPPEPVQIDFKKLLELANNKDPFKVPNGVDPSTNPDLKDLMKARFIAGFKAQLGVPSGLDENTNIVSLGNDVTSVEFNLLCASFTVVELSGGLYGSLTWMNQSQPPDKPWIFETKVNLQLVNFQGALSELPAVVQERITSLQLPPDQFSIQRLLFDLDNASIQTMPTITGVAKSSPIYSFLSQYFVGAYWETMKANKQPVLGHAITTQADSSSLALTSLRFQTSPFINGTVPSQEQQDLYTLCYVGAAGGRALPVTAPPFNWNWIEENEQSQWHGAVAINHMTFAAWLSSALLPYVKSQCVKFNPHCSASGMYIFLNCNPESGADPTTTSGPEGTRLAYFAYNNKEDSSARSSEITAQETFTLEAVRSSETQLKITHKVVVYLYVYVFGSWTSGNVVNSEITSVYDMGVSGDGAVYFKFNEKLSSRTDNAESLDFNKFSNWVLDDPNEKVIDPITNSIRSLIDMLGGPELSTARFIVPGHTDVVYSGARFANSGDLVFHLLYGTPS